MQEKTIEIIAPEGYEVDKERSSFEKIVFRALPDKGLPRSWEELGYVMGCIVTPSSEVGICGSSRPADHTARNTWPSAAEAEASIALAQLCQLRDRYNGGWKPDWTESNEKWFVLLREERPGRGFSYKVSHPLFFKTKELRDKFMENFSDLIEKAKPLLG